MDKRQQAVVSHKLEPYGWRTTQRESKDDYEQRATAGKWGSIASAVINYQNKHNGASPTDLMISKDSGLTPDQVRYHLREMEKAGLIKDVKGWPRHILVSDVTKVQRITQLDIPAQRKVEEAKVEHSHNLRYDAAGRKVSKKKPFMVRAREIAQAVIDHYDQYGQAPSHSWVKDRVYGPDAGGGTMSSVVKKMVQLGWLYHTSRRHRDLAVTGLGRAALFGQIGEQLHTDTPVNPVGDRPRATAKPSGYVSITAPDFEMRPVPSQRPVRDVRPTIPRPVRVAAPQGNPDLSNVEDMDLVLELNNRGFRVTR